MRNNWITMAFELRDTIASCINTGWVKPMNTRTQKTMWKESRRRANLPHSIKRRRGNVK